MAPRSYRRQTVDADGRGQRVKSNGVIVFESLEDGKVMARAGKTVHVVGGSDGSDFVNSLNSFLKGPNDLGGAPRSMGSGLLRLRSVFKFFLILDRSVND